MNEFPIEITEKYSISVCQPRWNHTYNMQLGETIMLTEPMPMTITATKQNGRMFTMVMVAAEKRATYVVTFSPEGCTTQVVECPTHSFKRDGMRYQNG